MIGPMFFTKWILCLGKRYRYPLIKPYQSVSLIGESNTTVIKLMLCSVQFSSVAQSCPTLWHHESQHTRPPCSSPTPGVHSDSCPSSQWCHPAISSSVVPFSSWLQPLPTSKSFPMSQLFAWGGQSKKRWQEYTEELYKKDLHDPDNHDGVITHLEPYVLECEVKWA